MAIGNVSYECSDWCFDLLPLIEGKHKPGRLDSIPTQRIRTCADCKDGIDYAYSMDLSTVLVISLKAKMIIAYDIIEDKLINCLNYDGPDQWIDVNCVFGARQQYGALKEKQRGKDTNIYILTKSQQILKFRAYSHAQSVTISMDYPIVPEKKLPFSRIIPYSFHPDEKFRGKRIKDKFWLWIPTLKLLQIYMVFELPMSDNTEADLIREIKVKLPANSSEDGTHSLSFNEKSLSMGLDEVKNSMVFADSSNHFMFEVLLEDKHSEHVCGCGKPDLSTEGASSKTAFLNKPFYPFIVRPYRYYESLLSKSSKQAIESGESILPRIILLFDSGNNRLCKIWQFPNSPSAYDNNGLDCVFSLMGDLNLLDIKKTELLSATINGPKSISIGLLGQITVLTKDHVYVLYSGAAFAEEKMQSQSGLDSDS